MEWALSIRSEKIRSIELVFLIFYQFATYLLTCNQGLLNCLLLVQELSKSPQLTIRYFRHIIEVQFMQIAISQNSQDYSDGSCAVNDSQSLYCCISPSASTFSSSNCKSFSMGKILKPSGNINTSWRWFECRFTPNMHHYTLNGCIWSSLVSGSGGCTTNKFHA